MNLLTPSPVPTCGILLGAQGQYNHFWSDILWEMLERVVNLKISSGISRARFSLTLSRMWTGNVQPGLDNLPTFAAWPWGF